VDLPKVFIGSSLEALDLAKALQSQLQYDTTPTVWDQDVFAPSEFPLESLLKQIRTSDFAVFVFKPDDITRMRNSTHPVVRDNVIFESGLFMGGLGRNHCFILTPRGADLHLPSDYWGWIPLDYNPDRPDNNLEAAVGPACSKIVRRIKEVHSSNRGLQAKVKAELPRLYEELQKALNKPSGI